jgi:hypothetical protein
MLYRTVSCRNGASRAGFFEAKAWKKACTVLRETGVVMLCLGNRR